jgi:hypothetical protein
MYSLHWNTAGNNNTANGGFALQGNVIGNLNTAIGYASLYINLTGEQNTAVGASALYSNTAGNYNTSTGTNSMFDNTTGYYNTAVGETALSHNSTGNYNTAIGYGSGPLSSALTNTSALGNNAFVTASNCINIGGSAASWIGGQVGWSAISDERFKRNIQENVHGLDFILKLKPVTYQWDIGKLDSYRGIPDSLVNNQIMQEARTKQETIVYTGFLAQQVEKAANEAGYNFSGVNKPANDKTPYSLTYESFTVPIVKSIQEQQQIIEEQKLTIEELKEQSEEFKLKNEEQKITNEELKAQNAELLKRIEKLENK